MNAPVSSRLASSSLASTLAMLSGFARCLVLISVVAGVGNLFRLAVAADSALRTTWDVSTARLLDRLEERQMPDVALWVLERLQQDPRAAEDLKKEVPYHRAVAFESIGRLEANPARRAEILAKAVRELDLFLMSSSEGTRAIQAYRRKGDLLIGQGRSKVEESKRPGADTEKLRAESVSLFDAAITTLKGPVREESSPIDGVASAEDAVLKRLQAVDASLKDLRGEGSGKDSGDNEAGKPATKAKRPLRKPGTAVRIADLEQEQDELRAELLETRLLIAGTYYDKSRALEPKSPDWEAALTESTKRYRELSETYRNRGAGLLARCYEGRNYVVLGRRKEALTALADIRALEGDDIVPGLRAKAIHFSLECWLEDQRYDEFNDRLLKIALVPLVPGRIDGDTLGMKYRAALLLTRRAAALSDKEKLKRLPLLRDAKRLAMEVARFNKDFSAESKTLLAELGTEVPDDLDGGPATFAAVMDSARQSLAAMKVRQAELSQAESAKNEAAIAAATPALAAERARAIALLQKAMSLAAPDDLDGLNQARSVLAYLFYAEHRFHDAIAIGSFLVARYPTAKGSPEAAQIVMAAWQQLQRQSVAGWADEAREKCVEAAATIMRLWPERPEAGDAAVVAIGAATEAHAPEQIVEILAKVPPTSPRRGETLLRAGAALWREVQEASRREEAARPPTATLEGWRAASARAIDDGLAGMPSGRGNVAVAVAAALARCQMAMEDGDNGRVAAVLEHKDYGPWTALTVDTEAFKSFKGGPLAMPTATASLRFFLETEQTDKAALAMKRLQELAAAAGPEASARLTAMYQAMGRDLQSQLDRQSQLLNLASGPSAGTAEAQARAAAILAGFETFLEGVAKDPKLSSQMWSATTYLNLGSGEAMRSAVPKAKAEGYLDRAADIYETMLEKGGGEIARFEPSIRLKLASVYRERERWEEAQKQMDWILADKKRQNTLDFQWQAAELLQLAAAKKVDTSQQAAAYGQAISGYKRGSDEGEIWGWGWAVISNRLEQQAFAGSDEKALEARRRFFQARLNAVTCRLAKADALPQDREREWQKAFDYIELTFKMHPELGGSETSKQFDDILREIEKRQKKSPRGLEGLRQSVETAAGSSDRQ